jgi:hypothetical protein
MMEAAEAHFAIRAQSDVATFSRPETFLGAKETSSKKSPFCCCSALTVDRQQTKSFASARGGL